MNSAPPPLSNRSTCVALLAIFAMTPACSGADDTSGESGFSSSGSATETGATTWETTDSDTPEGDTTEGEPAGDGDGDSAAGDGDGDDDSPALDCDALDCGEGTCVMIGEAGYCECLEGTDWWADGCGECPTLDAGMLKETNIVIPSIAFSGRFMVGEEPTPNAQHDDANMWLENPRTGDRISLGNTHDQQFDVRVTPGVYDIVYEVESPGPLLPDNPHFRMEKVAVFETVSMDINIPVATVNGAITLNQETPPAVPHDDAQLILRDPLTDTELLIGKSDDGSYSAQVLPGTYDVVYRSESPGDLMPRNDGAVLEQLVVSAGSNPHDIDIQSVVVEGNYLLNGETPPANQFDDANIELVSAEHGVVALGNTHDGSYDRYVIPGEYEVVYMHETGDAVPQNQRAGLGMITADGGGSGVIEILMVSLSGTMTINDEAPPQGEFDDGLLHLQSAGSDDLVALGNTHDGNYQLNLIPGPYQVYYAQESAGGTVPENKRARLLDNVDVPGDGTLDINVPAVLISGAITFSGEMPPSSVYQDGRLYLRNTATEDVVLLGNTYEGGYSALVVPGDYEIYYVQEVGGQVPSNQSAFLTEVAVAGAMSVDIDIPVVDLGGMFVAAGMEAPPSSPNDGGLLYLRDLSEDSAFIGESYSIDYEAKVTTGTYGVFYQSQGSTLMPENSNGRVGCITIE